MCLDVGYESKAKVAEEDIKCYKVIIKKYGNTGWMTPFMCIPIKEGEVCKSEIVVDRFEIAVALHSFTNLTAAKRELKWFKDRRQNNDPIVIKCIIPKGSVYYMGKYEYKNDCYASDTLVYPDKF